MERPLFIAEASSNHAQDLHRAHSPSSMRPPIPAATPSNSSFSRSTACSRRRFSRGAPNIARVRNGSCRLTHLAPLAERCRERGIQFSCTPFYLEAVEELRPFVDFYKVASYELLVTPLLEACAQTGKPIVLSTGMATMDEIVAAAATLKNAGARDVTLAPLCFGLSDARRAKPISPPSQTIPRSDRLRKSAGPITRANRR